MDGTGKPVARPHAAGRPAEDPARPAYAEAARTLHARSRQGVLATLDDAGHPYPSLVELSPLDDGSVLFLLSDLAEHTRNLKRDGRASLLLAADFGSASPLTQERLSLMGVLEPGGEAQREAYLSLHPAARGYVDFADFGFYRLRPQRAYYIGGFGRMGWSDAQAYSAARPDPLLRAAPGIVAHMNEDHPHTLLEYVQAFTEHAWAERARMLGVDRYGFDVEVSGSGRARTVRLSFAAPLEGAKAVRAEMVRLAREAKGTLAARS